MKRYDYLATWMLSLHACELSGEERKRQTILIEECFVGLHGRTLVLGSVLGILSTPPVAEFGWLRTLHHRSFEHACYATRFNHEINLPEVLIGTASPLVDIPTLRNEV
jgi:hypothetical protein